MSAQRRSQHDEAPGTEDYSEAGDWAGSNSVLAQGTSWRDGNPWADAPLHLMQLFDPDLRRAGASDAYGASCVTTWPGHPPSAAAGGSGPIPRAGGARRALPARLGGAVHAAGAGRDRRRHAHRARTSTCGRTATTRSSTAGCSARAGAPCETRVIDDADVDGIAGAGNGWLLPVAPLKRAHEVHRHGDPRRPGRRVQPHLVVHDDLISPVRVRHRDPRRRRAAGPRVLRPRADRPDHRLDLHRHRPARPRGARAADRLLLGDDPARRADLPRRRVPPPRRAAHARCGCAQGTSSAGWCSGARRSTSCSRASGRSWPRHTRSGSRGRSSAGWRRCSVDAPVRRADDHPTRALTAGATTVP